jgi:hypothetical protein
MDFIQSLIIFFGNMTLEIQDQLQIFQGHPPPQIFCGGTKKNAILTSLGLFALLFMYQK